MPITPKISSFLKSKGYSEGFLTELSRLLDDPTLQQHMTIFVNETEVDQALAALRLCMKGLTSQDQVARNLRVVNAGIIEALEFTPHFPDPDQIPSRPREQLFMEALFAFAAALDYYDQPGRSDKMINVKTAVRAYQEVFSKISVARQLARTTSRAAEVAISNLAVYEDQALRLLKPDYEVIRAAARADEELSELLLIVEDYLFGPSQQAAEQRKANDALRDKVTAEAEKRLSIAAAPEKKNTVAADLSSFLTVLTRLLPAAPSSEDRGVPR